MGQVLYFNFESIKIVKKETVELMFEKLQADDDADVVNVALVYLVSHTQLSNAKNVGVPDIIFRLANDLVWDEMRKGLLKATMNIKVKIKKDSKHYRFSGFPIVLQVFAYEILLELGQRYVEARCGPVSSNIVLHC